MPSITSFGLFWRRDSVIWKPGPGNANDFKLLGRFGDNLPNRRVADFRRQQGIYILYNEYGSVYVGLAGRRKDGSALGQRLKEHIDDKHGNTWSRFSWFGFDWVGDPDSKRFCEIKEAAQLEGDSSVSSTIRDTEALIMHIILPQNNDAITKFKHGNNWEQIDYDDYDKYLMRGR